MKRFIEENATSKFKIEDAAKYAGLSVSRSVHLFKEHTGKTMMEYATDIRLAAALERMNYTPMLLDQIAENCGFGNTPIFTKCSSSGTESRRAPSANGSAGTGTDEL